MLDIRLTQNRQHVRCDQKNILFVLLEISPEESTRIAERNHHVSLAIDCSGSMEHEKIQDAKDAAINLVRHLDPNDVVSIVTFATDVQVILNPTPASDPSIENAINSISVGGGTAMHGGIAAAFNMLQQTTAPNMIKRLEVFSDGEPNVMPYDDSDFETLVNAVRVEGITLDVFGIGADYNGPLLMQIAENGRGRWEHVSNSSALTKIVEAQVTEMQNTVISNPQLNLNLIEGAEIATIAITKPVLQEINRDAKKTPEGTISIGLKDIIKDEGQAIAARIALPPINGNNVPFLTASITEGNNSIAEQTLVVSCTNDKELYNTEVDPSPRVILSSSEATILFRKGIEGDQEATRMADTIIKSLDNEEVTKMISDDAHATIIGAKKVMGGLHGDMSKSEKKQLLHETTTIGVVDDDVSDPQCPYCGSTVRARSIVCGQCGKNIKK